MTQRQEKEKVIIDCDPGMDDSLALILAVKSKALDILAITTVAGNYPIEMTSANARKTLELIGCTDIPVAKGMGKPIIRELPHDPFTHGEDGQANYFLPDPTMPLDRTHGVDVIIDLVREYPGGIHLITLGPYTNVAMAIRKAPDIVPLIKKITSIAGTFGLNTYAALNATGGNAMSEWNVFVDPESADLVCKSGIPIDALGLDITTHYDLHCIEDRIVDLEKAQNKESDFINNMITFVKGIGWLPYCVLIDSMAVAAVINPEIVSFKEAHVGIETKGELTLGMTVVDSKHYSDGLNLPVVRIGYDADYRKFVDWVVDLVIQ